MEPNNPEVSDLYKRLGSRVHFFRTQKKLTQEKLAEKVGISLSFLGHIERGTRKASLETFAKLVIALDCSADELLGTGKQSGANMAAILNELLARFSDSNNEQ